MLFNCVKTDLKYTLNPQIVFDGKSFCITGKFDGFARSDLERCVKDRGGTFTPNVSEETDYLVIGSKGTRCCSFSCCTRVVEKALGLRDQGASLQFIRESDFIESIGLM
jgi:hypothetical protein